jgi:hypothetical protein
MRPRVLSPTGTVDRLFGIENLHAPLHSFGRAHRDAPDRIIADMLHDFAHEVFFPSGR